MVVYRWFAGGWTFLATTWIIIHQSLGYHVSITKNGYEELQDAHSGQRFYYIIKGAGGKTRGGCYRLFCRPLDSKAYHAAPAPTKVAPNFTPVGKGFPKTTTLNAKLVNLRIFKTIAIVKAGEMAVNRFTPRTQRYCVTTLIMRKNICRGMASGTGTSSAIKAGMWIDGEDARV